MENVDLEFLKYPTGRFVYHSDTDEKKLKEWITALEELPSRLTHLVSDLSDSQLDTAYRPEGWTVRQVVHHIADSHHHSYTRFKWTLTENEPLIKAYEEKDWSKLFDARTAPIQLSLTYLTALHAKLVFLLKGLSEDDLQQCFEHPEGNVKVSLRENIAKYAWHGNHHFTQIANLVKREGWA
ncbi:MAG: bacillithiol transferase BstA [Maribacter sp.]|uniref:YfiT family bacillithiol transferase n=1 Tax=Maribacter sp. 2307UL18-2 TaxID=3386274 RepID=UPI0039BD15EF